MRKYTILIVENDEDEQFFMKESFDASGQFDILAQPSNGDEMIEWFQMNPTILPDLILSDLNMPGKNGYDIISYIKNNPELSKIPVIITSTSSINTVKEKCLKSGADAFLAKPDTFIEYGPYINKLVSILEDQIFSNRN